MLKKRIPTIVGLLLLVLGAFGGVLFINQSTDFLPRAAPEYAPQKVKITNITENGFTVSWMTEEPTIGFIKHGETSSNLNTVTVDERDQLTGKSNEYRTHYITIQNIKPSTIYYFKLGSHKNQLYDNNGQAFQITTPNVLGTPPTADTAYGTIVTAANTPAEDAIVYVSIAGATPVSALVKQNGNWAVNLSTARTSDMQAYANYNPQTTRLDILVQPATGEVAKAVTTTGNDKPVPTITLGQSYDFANQQAPVEPGSETEANTLEDAQEAASGATPLPESKFSFQSIQATEGEIDPTINIITIPKDGVSVSTDQPEIKGKAPANTTLTITVHSNQAYTDQVQVDARGTWAWVPPGKLEPGEHTVSVSYTDTNGILHKITRQFVVDAADGDASMYAAPEYSATPSAEPTFSPEPSPTLLPTPLPTSIPTPQPRTIVATESADVIAGDMTPTLLTFLFGSTILVLGFYFTKKIS